MGNSVALIFTTLYQNRKARCFVLIPISTASREAVILNIKIRPVSWNYSGKRKRLRLIVKVSKDDKTVSPKCERL